MVELAECLLKKCIGLPDFSSMLAFFSGQCLTQIATALHVILRLENNGAAVSMQAFICVLQVGAILATEPKPPPF